MITAQDIREKTFEKARFSGYDMASVDDFLEELAEDVTATQKENAVLKFSWTRSRSTVPMRTR